VKLGGAPFSSKLAAAIEAHRSAATAALLHAIYERIVVAGQTFVSARLTPRHTLTDSPWRFPKRLQWRARQVLDAR
jgi:hypothetical protein